MTNKIKGFNSSEPINAITLQRNLSADEYKDDTKNPKYMIIKIKDYWLNQRNSRYDCTRSAWKLDPKKANNYPYVLSVTGGMVYEVYKVKEWHYCEERNGRAEFTGEVAEPEIQKLFKWKKIPEKYRKKGQASPFLYCKIDE